MLENVLPETAWAYSTVKTMLARLVEKGALSEQKRGNTSVYKARVSRERARRTAVRSLLDKAFDGAFGSLVHHLVADEKLSRRDRKALADMLRELDNAGETAP